MNADMPEPDPDDACPECGVPLGETREETWPECPQCQAPIWGIPSERPLRPLHPILVHPVYNREWLASVADRYIRALSSGGVDEYSDEVQRALRPSPEEAIHDMAVEIAVALFGEASITPKDERSLVEIARDNEAWVHALDDE